MTFALHNITITNFRSYKGTHKFKFPTKEGTYYLTGENLVEDIGANGAGKTTFMDAIVWCLYGATSRGLKATDVLPDWETPGCKVRLELTVGDQKAAITRTQKPNNLTLDDKIVDQVELEKYLRLNQAAFLNSVLNAQFGQSFFSLSASEKLSLFSDINGLEKWLDYSKAAADKANTLERQMAELHNKEVRLQENIKSLRADIANLETEAAGFEGSRKAKLKALDIEYSDNYLKIRKLGTKLGEFDSKIKELDKALTLAQRDADCFEEQRDECLQFMSKFANEKSRFEGQKQSLEKQIKELKDLKDSKNCPLCNCPIDAGSGHLMLHMGTRMNDLTSITHAIAKVGEAHKKWTKQLFEIKVKFDSAALKVAHTTSEILNVKKERDKFSQSLYDLERRNAENDLEAKQLSFDKNPYKKFLGQKQATLTEAKAELKQVSADLADKEAAHASNVFWVKGFKRVRLYIIEQVFQALEVEVNNCLTQLGMQDWQITFDIERENKSGGVTKGFMVFVKSPRNKAPVKWENWSGGETQRLQLAGDLALANLIMHQAGLKNTIEFFDEPSTHLSTQGMLDFANLLHERALSDGKCIWIIDHAAISNFGEFEAVITVRKDSNGSQITTTT